MLQDYGYMYFLEISSATSPYLAFRQFFSLFTRFMLEITGNLLVTSLLFSFRQKLFCIFEWEMHTDFALVFFLVIPFLLLVELLSLVRNFGHTHTQSTLALIYKFISPQLPSFRQKWFCIFEWEMNTDFAWPMGLEIPLFLLSYYYDSVTLVIHTHKSP